MPIEHKSTYLPVPYIEKTDQSFFLKDRKRPATEPDIEMFLETRSAQNHLNEVQAEGFELISAVPILRAIVQSSADFGPAPYGFAYPLTAGIALFWKRYVEQKI